MTTLHAKIAKQILAQIDTGALRVGDRLPPEEVFAAELGISRSTLRQAFSDLAAAGVLKRKKRAGTEIISDRPKQRFNMATSDVNELLSLGRDTEFEVFSTRTVPTENIAQLKGLLSETGFWLEIYGARRMTKADRPFSVNRVYVPARYAGIEKIVKTTKTSVFQIIEDTYGIAVSRISQSVQAIACPRVESKIMGLRTGDPALHIEAQLFLSDGTLMEVSLATFDPTQFQVRTDVEIK